jgi:hypothetical protein
MNEEIVKSKLALMFPDKEVKVLYRLMGGMSNYTYVVQIGDNRYTYRIPGEYSEHFVNREIEIENIKIVETLGITPIKQYILVLKQVKRLQRLSKEPHSIYLKVNFPIKKWLKF